MGGRGATSGGSGTIKNSQGKDVPFMKTVPKGWKENTYATTAPKGYTWIDNGKSHFDKDYKSAIVPESALKGR